VSDARAPPNFRQVIVDIAKLHDYCLSPSHPHGRHKARVFRSRLGLQSKDAAGVREALLNAVREHPERLMHRKTDHHGRHYVLAVEMSSAFGTGIIRSIWIVPTGEEDVLRFVTCYLE
jgi:hypothetical protein